MFVNVLGAQSNQKYLHSRFMIKFIQYFNKTITSYIKIHKIKGYFNIFSSKSVKKEIEHIIEYETYS